MDDRIEHMLLQHEIEQFYYEEAAMLDERRFADWLALLTSGIHYWMPIRRTVMLDDIESEFTKPGDMASFDDDKSVLEARVKTLDTGFLMGVGTRRRAPATASRTSVCSSEKGRSLGRVDLPLPYEARGGSRLLRWGDAGTFCEGSVAS